MGDSPEKQQCLFCLEEETAENILIQINYQQYYSIPTCTCRIISHTGCYIQYSTHKGRSECPICHRIYESEQQPPQTQEYIIIENRLYQHQPSLPIVTTEQSNTICMSPSRIIQSAFLCSIVILCGIVLFLRR
jgi:hypothetical protein